MRSSDSTLLYAYITFWLTNGFENTNLLLRVPKIHDHDLTFKFNIHSSKKISLSKSTNVE